MGNAWVILGVEWNISQDNIGSDFVTGSHFHHRTHFTFWWNGYYQRITLSQILWLDQMYDWVTTGLQSFPTEPKKSKFQEDWCKNGHATRRKSQKRTLKNVFPHIESNPVTGSHLQMYDWVTGLQSFPTEPPSRGPSWPISYPTTFRFSFWSFYTDLLSDSNNTYYYKKWDFAHIS